MNRIYLYALAVTAKKYGINVHVPMLMSNHEHLGCTDTRGELPSFMRDFHRLVANAVKIHRGWDGAVWDSREPNVVDLPNDEAIVQKMAYAIVNPVRAGLVKHHKEWPGVTVDVDDVGRKVVRVRRPRSYFNAENPEWPDVAEFPLVPLPLAGDDDATQLLADEVRIQQREALEHVRANGWRIRGRHRVLTESPYNRGKSFTPYGQRTPTFAVGRGNRSAFFEAAAKLRAFRQSYREALEQWRSGVRTAPFPKGTWWMLQFHQVAIT